MKQALNLFQSSRYMVELTDGKHEFRPEDAGDLFTWMVTFFNAYLDVQADPGAMGRLIRMQGVDGGRVDNLTVDVHIPFATDGDAQVRELYNSRLNHFYVTTDATEIQFILAGGQGDGWSLTGQGFRAWTSFPPNAFMTAVPVCRFELAPRGRPWSTFYTSSASDCTSLKADRGWIFTGTPWYIQPVNSQLACPDGYIGVNRAYNQGAKRNDSNHRFSTSDSTMHDMERVGWVYEATVMCSRP